MKKYTITHEWLLVSSGVIRVGVTEHIARVIGRLINVDLPRVGVPLHAGHEAAFLESAQRVYDVYAPATGIVVRRNEQLLERPEMVNESPEGSGWLFEMSVEDSMGINHFITESDYKKLNF